MKRLVTILASMILSPITALLVYALAGGISLLWMSFGQIVMTMATTGFVWWMAAILYVWSLLGLIVVIGKVAIYCYQLFKQYQQTKFDLAQRKANEAQHRANIDAGLAAFKQFPRDPNFKV